MSRYFRGLVICLYMVGLLLGGPTAPASAAVRESILYQDGSGAFYRVDPDGSNTMRLLSSLGTTASYTRPTPDGTQLLNYLGLANLQLSSTGGLGAVNITPVGFHVGTPYAYSPDGAQIAFPGRTGGASFTSVYKMNADGTGATLLVPLAIRNQSVFDWGAGGILYKDWDGTKLTFPLWVVDPVSLVRTRLSPDNYTILDARWSPDGSKIAFIASERIGSTIQPYALYVKHAGGTYKISTTPSIVPNSVSWAPAGDRVALTGYASGDSGHYKVFDVSLDLGTNTGTVTVITSSTTSGSTGYVWWGDLTDPSIPTSISTVDLSGEYSQTVTLQATLLHSGSTALTGAPVTFRVGGVPVGTATTNAAGVATLSYTITNTPGTYTISAAYAGDALYSPATTTPSGDKSLTVTKAVTTVATANRTLVAGDPLTISATLSALSLGLPGKSLVIKVDGVTVSTQTTDGAGAVSYTYTPSLAAGTYPIDISYAGDANYTAASATVTLTVTKAPVTLTAADQTIAFGDPVTMTATLLKAADSAPIAGQSVQFSVNGTVVGSGTTNASGVASYSYTPSLAGGTYPIVASFAGSGIFQAGSDTASLTVTKAVTTLTTSAQTITYGQPVTLSATLMAGATPVAGATIQFAIGGTTVGNGTTNTSGIATYTYTPSLGGGTYPITATFAGDTFYYGATGTATLTVNKAATAITVSSVTTDWGTPVNLTATLTSGGSPLTGRSLTFKVDGTNVGTATTNAAGVATLSYTPTAIPPGNHTITVDFAGDPYYLSASGTGNLIVNQASTSLTAADVTIGYNQSGSLTATLMSGTTPISGKPIQFQVNGTVVGTATTNASGVAALAFTPTLAAGTYTIDAAFAGDVYYLGATDAAQLTVTKAPTVLTATDRTIQFGDPVTLSATLTSGGSPVAGKTVSFKVNGTAVGSAVTNASGVATYSYTPALASGAYTIDADWAGDAFYLGSTDAATLTVTKALTALVADDVTLTYGVAGSLTATLTESGTGNPVSGRPLAFKVNGTAVGSATTNAAGVATLAYTPTLAAGTYTIQVDFTGDGFYNASTDSATLTVNKSATALVAADVSVTYGQVVNLTATLTSGGSPVAGKTVAFAVNGTAAGTATTNAAGLATLPWTANLAAGTYTIDAGFAGDGFYLASTDTATATVNKAATALVAADVTVAYGQSVALTATLTSGGSPVSGKSVQFQVDGTNVGTGTTNAAGVASFSWTANLPAGTHTIDATFAGDGFYLASADAASATVTKAATAIATADVTVPYGSAVTLQATLTSGANPVAGKSVTFSVNGAPVGTGTTDAAGVATLNWTATLAAGTYPLVADFAGDSFYLAASATKQATVTKPATTLAADDQTVTYGQSVTLSATLTQTVGGAPISGKVIEFKVAGTVVGTGTTNGAGVATFSYTPTLPGGTHTIDATFVADAFYLGATDAAWLTVTKAASSVVAADQSVTYGQSVNLTATLTSGATPLNGRNVSFKVNGVGVGTVITDATGVATLPWTANLAAGTYTIDATFAGDAFYLASADTAGLTVNKAVTAIVAADVTVAYGQTVALTATLTSGGSPVGGKTVQFQVDGTAVGSATTDATGLASLNWTANLAAGTYTIDVAFAGDTFYLGSTDAATLTVNKATTTLATADVTAPYGSAVTLSATLTSGATPVNGKTVTFKVNGSAVGSGTTNGSGVATFSWTANLAAGNYPLVAEFAGDSFYQASTNTKQATVTKPATTLVAADVTALAGNSVTLSATLTQTAGGAPISGKSIEFQVSGSVVGTGTTDAAGVATYSYTPAGGAGTYTIDATFAPDAFYLGSTDAATLTLTAVPATIAAVDVSGAYNSSVNLTATLTSGGGAPVTGKPITFKVDGTNVGTATTNAAGVATLAWTINVAAGTYTIDAIWAGDPFYGPATDSTHDLTVTAAGTTLVTADKTATYGQSVNLTATLTSGALPVAGKSISFKVNGTAVGSATTDAAGLATLAWTANLAGGTYTITADYAGDGFYLAATDDGTLTLNKAVTTITAANVTVAYGSSVNLTATLQSGGANLASKLVTFTVNGAAVGSATTNASGVATLSWTANLAAGNWPLVASFAGDSFYLASSDTKQVTITKPATVIVADDKAINALDPVTLTATLTTGGSPLAGKPVDFKVNGTLVGSGTTNAAGVASYSYTPTLAAGTYTIDATFSADSFYLGSTDAASLVIAAVGTTLAVDDVYGTYGQTVPLTATLTRTAGGAPVSGKLITFKVNGTIVGTATTDATGVATLSWTVTLGQGSYPIDAAFAGDSSYGATNGTATATIDPAFTTLTTANVTGTYNQSVNLTGTLMAGATPVAGKLITFRVNGTDVGTATTNASGVATLPYVINVAAGTYTLQVLWAGDVYFDPSSDTAILTVNKATTAIVAVDQSVGFGGTAGLSATLTTGGSPLVGKTVEFRVNGALVGTGTTDASGVASYNYTAALPAGSYPIDATFPGDGGYLTSTDNATLTITKPATAIVAADQTVTAGLPVSLTATLTAGGNPVAGKLVEFKVNGTVVGTATTNGSGVATYTFTPGLAAGTYPIDATFVADAFYLGSTDAASLVINAAPTTLLTANVTATYGSITNLSATLTAGGSPVAGKLVSFAVNGTSLGTATTNASGVATFSGYNVTLAAGTYPIVVSFAGDGYYASSTDSKTLTVTKAATVIVAPDLSVEYGASALLSASLTAGGSPLAGRTVTFKNGATVLGTGTTDAVGVATFNWAHGYNAGTVRTLTAEFAGDAYYNLSTDTMVMTVVKASTTLAPTSGLTVDYNAVLNLTALLARSDNSNPINAKPITFKVNGGTLAPTQNTNASGIATYAWTANLAPGTYSFDVTWPGDANYNAASGSTTLTVAKRTRTLNLTATVNPVQYSDQTSLTATVSPAQSGLTVTFKQGATVLGTATTDAAGVASLANYQIPWPAGSYPITADVAGDAFYTSATGNVNLTVTKETVSFSYTGDTSVQGTSYPFLLQSKLADGDGSVLDYGAGNVQVRWTISGSGFTTQTYTATVDATGKAEKSISLQKRAYNIVAEILVNGYIVEQTLAPVPIVSAGTGTGLWGTYFEDFDSQTSPFTGMVLSRLDAQVNFNWGASNPEPTVFGDSDTFSVRWTGYIEPMYSETYEFCINANEGVRFWFGGTQRINQWTTRTNAQEFCWTSGALTAGTKYPVTLEYFDQTGNAEVQLYWRTTTTTNQPKVPIQKSQLYPEVTASWKNGEGLTGRYYDSAWNGTHGDNGDGVPELLRNDASIYYSWDLDPLSPLVRSDQFYVEWKGRYTPAATHSRMFTFSDDGVRLWMRPTGCGCAYTKVLENWNDHSPRWDNSANNPLGSAFTAGVQYDVWLEFYEHAGQAWIWLATGNSSANVIPQSRFRVELMPATPTGLAGSAPASDRVDLSWTANPLTTPQVSGYVIFRSTTSGFTPDQTTLVGSSNTTTFTDYNRDPATTYYYKIAAIDTASNISGFTAQISVTTP